MASIYTALMILLCMSMASLVVMGVNQDNSNLLFRIVMNPGSIGIGEVLLWLAISSAIGIAGTLVGVFIFKNDVFIFGVPFTMLVALAHPSMVSFYQEIAGASNTQVAMIIIAPIYLTYIIACLVWLRTGR